MYKDASKNICDFVMFKTPRAFLIEAKTVTGNYFSIQSKSKTTGQMETFRQYPLLLQKKNIPNLFAGVMLWFQKHDKVIWVPIEELEKMINDDLRSINIKMLKENKYKMIEIPSVKMRVFMKSDYSIMMNIEKE